jgi:hypothetical protein
MDRLPRSTVLSQSLAMTTGEEIVGFASLAMTILRYLGSKPDEKEKI